MALREEQSRIDIETLQADVRDSALYREVEDLYRRMRQPGTGQISDAAEVHVSPENRHAVFAGVLMDKLEGAAPSRICRIDLASGETRVLTFGPNTDRLPRYAPDGRHIAFLSDRHKAGDFQLYLLDPGTGAVRYTPHVEGWVEYLHWSPDGRRIVMGVAGHGADVSGAQGAITTKRAAQDKPSWMPTIQAGDDQHQRRHAWIYDLATNRVRQVGTTENIWEVAWCGNEALAAVVSPGPGEGLWYNARLHVIDANSGASRELYAPKDQLGWPAGSPDGKHVAIVEAICSDRWAVAGELLLVATDSGEVRCVRTQDVNVTYVEWHSPQRLLIAGHRGFETVVGHYDITSGCYTEVWASRDLSSGGRYISVSGLSQLGDCVLIGESFTQAPHVATILNGEYRCVKSFDIGYGEDARAIAAAQPVSWQAPDGLEIQGWLLRPRCSPPYPLIMNVHGGPVSHWPPLWLGRRLASVLMLIRRGYAIFLPNPRGSSGRGQAYVRHVLGDMGGADTYDYLSGLDHLVKQGIADPHRLGVTGASYGGFMTSWLVTQDVRFAAAVSVAPVTNQVTLRLISNIPHFVDLFLADRYANPGGRYFQRSPIMHAHKVRTPTLNICGALDRCTPPEEAVQFHNALLENGVESVLLTYPEEGHGVRKLPAAIDYAVRVIAWFERHMPPNP